MYPSKQTLNIHQQIIITITSIIFKIAILVILYSQSFKGNDDNGNPNVWAAVW